jgi:hypothetical protein
MILESRDMISSDRINQIVQFNSKVQRKIEK